MALKAVLASPNFTDFTGAAPILGRAFAPDDAASESAARVVLLSEGLWKRRFGADPAVVGQSIELNDASYQVVGVLPASFRLRFERTVDMSRPSHPRRRKPRSPARSGNPRQWPGSSRVIIAAAEQALTAAGTDGTGASKGWSAKLMHPSELAGQTLRRACWCCSVQSHACC